MRVAPLLAALVLVTACSDNEKLPPGGGGGGGGGGGTPIIDAGGTGEDGGGNLARSGRVCAVSDLRAPTLCGAASPEGVTVVVHPGGRATSTATGGEFAIDDGATRLEVADGDAGLHPSRVEVAPWTLGAGVIAPVIGQAAWDQLLAGLGVLEGADDGSIVVYLVDGERGTPLAGAELDPVAGAVEPPRYAGATATSWQPDAVTGTSGAVLVVGVPPGSATLTARIAGKSRTLSVPVAAGALTFALLPL
jgi:hypothetical protein